MHFFKFVLSLALLVGHALAQGAYIAYPPPGSTFVAGSNTTVQIGVGIFIQAEDFIALAIGLAPCSDGNCPPPSVSMGTVLYQGPYIADSPHLYENFTLTVPEDFPVGDASLNVISLYLIGLELYPVLQPLNETVTVVAAT